jgi:hypothetical protein
MNSIGLYVYAPTTFTTDTKIEPMKGRHITAGEVTLEPGVYRLAEGATLVPKSDTMSRSYSAMPEATGPSYSIVSLDTKGGPPDPPLSPIQGYTTSQIHAFFGGAGSDSDV